MKALVLAVVASLALIAPLAAQPPAPAADPLIRENATRRISDHVWAIPDFRTPLVPNVGIVRGTQGTLVIDTGLGDRNAQIILREVANVVDGSEAPPRPG